MKKSSEPKKPEKMPKKPQKRLKNHQKQPKNDQKQGKKHPKLMKNAKIKPFLAQKKPSKNPKNPQNTQKQHFFLQIQRFYKFFTRDNDLIYSSINPYLYICRNIYNKNNNIIIGFLYRTF